MAVGGVIETCEARAPHWKLRCNRVLGDHREGLG